MAPRATFRRRSRDRNPDSSTDNVNTRLIGFQKPNLPPLQGTPSSRRQYSYGSGVEPLPSKRRGRGGDLASAVRGALIPRGRKGQDDVVTPKTTAAHPAPDVEEDGEDELARDENDDQASPLHEEEIEESMNDPPGKPEPPGKLPDPLGYGEEESDLDDARSFDMENDYFDGATIDSMVGDVSPPPLSVPPSLSVPPVPSEPPFPEDPGDKRPRGPRGPTTSPARPTAATNTREAADSIPPHKSTTEVDHDDEDRQPSARPSTNLWPSLKSIVSRAEVTALATPPETDSQLSQEAETSTRRSSNSRLEASQLSDQASVEGRDDRGMFPVEKATKALRGNFLGGSKTQQQNFRPLFSISPARHDTDLFQRTNERTRLFGLQSDTSRQSPRRTNGALPLRQAGRYDFEQERQRLSPDSWSEQDDDDEISWLHFLNPWVYLEPAWWSFYAILGRLWRGFLSMLRRAKRSLQSIRDSVVDTVSDLHTDSLQDHLTVAGSNLIYMVTAILVLLITVAVSRVAYENLPAKMSGLSMSPGNFPSLPTLGDVADRLGRFVPSWPRSSDDEWEEFVDLQGERSDDGRFQKIDDWRREVHRELGKMKKSGNLHELSIQKLESVMPKVVHMTLKDGKPVVAPEFWHAIRDLIHQDGSFLTLEKKGSEYDIANEGQWKSIVSRLTKDPAFASHLDQGLAKTENRLTKQLTGTLEDTLAERLPAFWDSWVTSNDRKISQAIGSALNKMELPATPKELDARLKELVKQHMGNSKGGGGGGKLVTRSDFLRHVENEFAAHRAEIKAEMSELEPKLKQLVKDSIALAKDELPDGMARAEVENLVKALVKKSLADMNLEALARGKIHAHWDQDLKHQINHFGPGAGATFDGSLTSTAYKPEKDDVSRKGNKPYDAVYALMAWLDDGDCWCGSRSMSKHNNPYDVRLSVKLAQTIIPQHVVVEHILPGATRDPGARPKDIEVYAHIEDPETRERLRDFAAVHLPDDKEDWDWTPPAIPDSFVKIGQFVYEGAELHDGVHVHHLSPELLDLGAETDQVVIRATSNYGAKFHTCFYRVRLYGQEIEGKMESVPPDIVKSRVGWRSWL